MKVQQLVHIGKYWDIRHRLFVLATTFYETENCASDMSHGKNFHTRMVHSNSWTQANLLIESFRRPLWQLKRCHIQGFPMQNVIL